LLKIYLLLDFILHPPPLKLIVVPVTPLQQNASVVICTATNKAAVIDPGGDVTHLMRILKQANVTPEKILLTHAHIDHAGGAADLAEKLNLPIEGPDEEDAFLLATLDEQGKAYGIPEARKFIPTRWLTGGDIVTVGDLELEVRFVPGHTPGHIVFIHHASKLALVGDTLFQGSVGRTDFPRSSHQQLMNAISEQLMTLPDDYTILPGHGSASTIGDERANNPYISRLKA
jgi:hydroxyacylglutathione hydrolase